MSRSRRRRARILELLTSGRGDVEELAGLLDISPSTIRRDLAAMAEEGHVTRTYGGAVLAHAQPEHTLSAREDENRAAKDAIARAAAALIEDGDRVALDAGSTVGALGRLLAGRPLHVVTSNLPLAPILANAPPLELTVLGGVVRPMSMGVVGPLAELAMRRMSVDKAFLGCDGVVAERGLCEASADQTSLKELMMRQAAEIFVLADSSKLGRADQPFWALSPARWTLITDASAADEQIEPFRRMKTARVIRAA